MNSGETIDNRRAARTAPFARYETDPGKATIGDYYENALTGRLRRCVATDTWIDVLQRFDNLPIYANNAAALAGGLAVGVLYRTGGDPDGVCVTHAAP
jgi:hypothetical protein